ALLLYTVQNWIGVEEPKAVVSAPTAGGLADRAGLRSGDWVRSWSREGGDSWEDVRSLTDLRWQIMQSALDGQRLRLTVSDVKGQGRRQLTLDLDRVEPSSIDSGFLGKVVGLTSPYAPPVMGDPVVGGPADRAGLRKGDRVVRVDGLAVEDASQLRERIRRLTPDGQAPPMTWMVERDGATIELVVRPRVMAEGERRWGRIDAIVGQLPEMVTVRLGPFESIARASALTWEQSLLTAKMFGRMLVGEASLKNLSGPITIADYAGQSAERGIAYYLGFLALVSVGLGVLNLMPIPLLDGGHLMYYLFEGLTGRPISDLWLRWLQRGGALVLVLMMTLALSNDVARLLGLH
ncbi:MAG: RIP metalloprotease RseP, partial [Aquincola sp.]|nr:RIP metalloprotease RseP [Aquincola sp.]